MFKVGDRVEVVRRFNKDTPEIGSVGTVKEIDHENREAGIEFDNCIMGHSLLSKCKSGHGWWVLMDEIGSLNPYPARTLALLQKARWVS